jgi:hypothetical protein
MLAPLAISTWVKGSTERLEKQEEMFVYSLFQREREREMLLTTIATNGYAAGAISHIVG